MVWGQTWLSRAPVVLPSSRLLKLRLRLLSMEVMLEEEVVRERARRLRPADGTRAQDSSVSLSVTETSGRVDAGSTVSTGVQRAQCFI